MGYVEETGVAQHYRDARILPIYEGTNGIQAADLVGRKLGMRSGGVVHDELDRFESMLDDVAAVDGMAAAAENMRQAISSSREATEHLVSVASNDPASLLASSTPYLRMLGTTVCAGLLAGSVLGLDPSNEFEATKIASARFFCEQLLPAAQGWASAVKMSSETLYAIPADAF
jgi:acyl-CoA dehydrogenase